MPETTEKPPDQEQFYQEKPQHETLHHTRDTRRGQDGRCSYRGTLQYHRHTEPPLRVCPALQGQVSLSGSAGLWTSLAHLSVGIHGAYAEVVVRHLQVQR